MVMAGDGRDPGGVQAQWQLVHLWCNIAPDDYWREYHHAQAEHFIHAAK